MAEQKLYIMKNSFGLTKIGVSVDPERRANEIRLSSGVPVELVHELPCKNAFKTEQALHKHFVRYRKEGEWFSGISPTEILNKAIILEGDRIPVGKVTLGKVLPCMKDPVTFIKLYYKYNYSRPENTRIGVLVEKLGYHWMNNISLEDFPDSRIIFNSLGGCSVLLCKDCPFWKDTLKRSYNYEWFPCKDSGDSYVKHINEELKIIRDKYNMGKG